MAYLVELTAPRQVSVREYAEPTAGPDEVRVRTLYSGISAGTELTQYRGTNPYPDKQWDATEPFSARYPHPELSG